MTGVAENLLYMIFMFLEKIWWEMKINRGREMHVSSYVKDVNEVPFSLEMSKNHQTGLCLVNYS